MKSEDTQTSGRKLRRFFVETALVGLEPGAQLRLSNDQTAHVRRVIRLQEGDRCLVTDGLGAEAETLIVSYLSSGEAVLKVLKVIPPVILKRPKVRIYSAMIQKAKIDFLVEKLQELEIEALIPVETSWTVIKMNQAESVKAGERWQRLAKEAAKQSGALRLMRVEKPVKFQKALEEAGSHGKIVLFHPGPEALAFAEWSKSLSMDSKINLFFGPEAGFTDAEAELARSKGVSVALTRTLLKADTAALGVAASLRFLFP